MARSRTKWFVAAPVAVVIALSGTAPAWAGFPGTDVFVASVGHGAGAGGSQWRTVLWIYNPTMVPANCQIQLLLRNQANPSPPTYDVTVQPGDTVRFDDAVWTLFGIEGYGALRIVSDRDVVVNSRIYNQPGSDISDTQGQFFSAVPASFAIGAGESTDVLGVNQAADDAFRYNYGFVETTGHTATIRVTLFDGDGTELGSRTYTLDPFEAMQVGLADLGAGSRPTDNGRLHVEVTGGSGRVIAFGSGIANTSQDPSTFEMTLHAAGSGSGLTRVAHDGTLTGDGTSGNPLGLADGAVTAAKIAAGTVVRSLEGVQGSVDLVAGSGVTITPDSTNNRITIAASGGGGGLSLPYHGTGSTTSSSEALFRIDASGPGRAMDLTADSGTVLYLGGHTIKNGNGIQSKNGVATLVVSNNTTNGEAGYFVNEQPSATAPTIYAESHGTIGVEGTAPNGVGLWGEGLVGVLGKTQATSGPARGVEGGSLATTGTSPGVYGWTNSGSNNATAVLGEAKATGGLVYGVRGINHSMSGAGVRGESPATGVSGAATASSGTTYGVWGWADSDNGYGVYGYNNKGHGVYGITLGDWGWHSGVYGEASRDHANGVTGWNRGGGTGVYAVSESGTPFIGKGGGSVLMGLYDFDSGSRVFRVDRDGTAYADGGFQTGGADFAEMYPASEPLEPGTVVAIGDDGRLVKASAKRPTAVMGVVPQKSTIVGNAPADPGERAGMVPVAIVGIVEVHASAAAGAIRPGDLLRAGTVPGTAEKAVWATPGTVIGKALEPLPAGEGSIRMLVTLR